MTPLLAFLAAAAYRREPDRRGARWIDLALAAYWVAMVVVFDQAVMK